MNTEHSRVYIAACTSLGHNTLYIGPIILKSQVWEVEKGRNNLFYSLILLLFYVKEEQHGMLGTSQIYISHIHSHIVTYTVTYTLTYTITYTVTSISPRDSSLSFLLCYNCQFIMYVSSLIVVKHGLNYAIVLVL